MKNENSRKGINFDDSGYLNHSLINGGCLVTPSHRTEPHRNIERKGKAEAEAEAHVKSRENPHTETRDYFIAKTSVPVYLLTISPVFPLMYLDLRKWSKNPRSAWQFL